MTRKRNCKQRIGQKWKLFTSGPGYQYIVFRTKLNKQLKVIQYRCVSTDYLYIKMIQIHPTKLCFDLTEK